METLNPTFKQHPHSLPRPPQQPWQCSSWHHLANPQAPFLPQLKLTIVFLPRPPRSRYDIITPHAVRARNFYFDPRSFSNNNDDDDNENDDGEFVRRRRRRSGRRSKRRQWWSYEVEYDEPKGGIVEQAVDNLWILQVFRSYGLFLPVVLISLLLATGPKAFLLGSGVFFGLSTLVFTFKKLSEWVNGTPKSKRRRRTNSRFDGKEDVFREDDYSQSKRNKESAYKTRVGQADRRAYDRNPDSATVKGFGGWDELVGEEESERPQRPPQTKARLEMMTEEVRLNGALKEKDVPLVLRLLIAVFPFLGSWTNLL